MVLPLGEPVHARPSSSIPAPNRRSRSWSASGSTAPTHVAGVLAATDAVLPAIEVVDTRYSEPFRLPDSVADNAGAARVVLGAQARRPAELVDLRVLGCVFRHRGGIETAAGGAVMGHPAAAVAWLAERARRARRGHRDRARIVLSGGLTASRALLPGRRRS